MCQGDFFERKGQNTIINPLPLFRPAREKRLQLWALATLIAIFSTLGLVQTLAG